MSELVCPRCRLPVSDAALDAGNCPGCGYDGPVVTAPDGKWAWLAATVGVLVTGVALGGYLLFPRPEPPRPKPGPEPVAALPPAGPFLAPFPRPVEPAPPAKPPEPPVIVSPPKPVDPPPLVLPPKPGRVIVLDPREEPGRKLERRLDSPDETAAVPDLNGEDRVALTGRIKTLRVGSVGRKAVVDASGLTAAEVVVTGDLSGDAVVKLNAPGGKVTVGGFVTGRARLAVTAAGGEVLVAEGSDRVNGEAVVTVTARRVEVRCGMTGTARLLATLTAGGSLKLGVLDRQATVVYKKAAATDPAPTVEHGEIRGGAKVTAEEN